MKNQQDFIQGLQDLVRIGKTNGDVLSQQEIKDYFSEYELDEQQMGLLASYMAENQIQIQGVVPTEEPEVEEVQKEEEPSPVLNMYMEEIHEITKRVQGEEAQLVKELEQGNEEAVTKLLELNLEEITKLANLYRGKGVQTADLIQEGNLAVFCAITGYDQAQHGEFHAYIMKQAEEAMEQYLDENTSSTRAARQVARRVNQLNDLATAYAKEHEKEATPEELAAQMNITVEEVKDLMKMSLDAVNVLEQQ